MEETYVAMAKQMPADKRDQFVIDMRAATNAEKMEKISRNALIETFTLDEINALANFFSSSHGASGLRRFGEYMNEIMPALLLEIQKSIEEIEAMSKK